MDWGSAVSALLSVLAILGALLLMFVLMPWNLAIVTALWSERYRPDLEPLATALGPEATTSRRAVEGRRAGRRVRVSSGQAVSYSVEIPAGSAELSLDDARAARDWVRGAGAHEREVQSAIDRLATCGVSRIQAADGWITAHRAFSDKALHPSSALPILDALARLASLLGRAPLQVRVAGAHEAALAWAEGARLLCPFCRDDLVRDDLELMRCPACRTAHHAECFGDAGGCTVLGCRGAPERRPDARERA